MHHKNHCPEQQGISQYYVRTAVWYDGQYVAAGGILTTQSPIPEPLPSWVSGTVRGHFYPGPVPSTADAGNHSFGIWRG